MKGVLRIVTHSEVVIAADRATIWPHIVEPNSWKQGLQPVHESGPVGSVGMVEAARGTHEGADWALMVETVALDPERRKVVRITTEPGDGSPQWAAWHLFDRMKGTLLTYDVFGESPVPDGTPQAVIDAYQPDQQARFDAELIGLRDFLEADTTPAGSA